jgi:hypothetical protein
MIDTNALLTAIGAGRLKTETAVRRLRCCIARDYTARQVRESPHWRAPADCPPYAVVCHKAADPRKLRAWCQSELEGPWRVRAVAGVRVIYTALEVDAALARLHHG